MLLDVDMVAGITVSLSSPCSPTVHISIAILVSAGGHVEIRPPAGQPAVVIVAKPAAIVVLEAVAGPVELVREW